MLKLGKGAIQYLKKFLVSGSGMILVSFKSLTRSRSDVLFSVISMQLEAYSYTDQAISSLSKTAVVDLS